MRNTCPVLPGLAPPSVACTSDEGMPADGARALFITSADGETVTSPARLACGIEGISVVPAGDDSPQMLPGDHLNIPHDPPARSEQITIRAE